MWIRAIQAASGDLAADTPALRWQQLLCSANSETHYKDVLARLTTAGYLLPSPPLYMRLTIVPPTLCAPNCSPVTVSADWVRVQAATVRRRRLPGGETRAATRQAAVKAAEEAARRRRAGHAVGDRVSMDQLHKDVTRDTVPSRRAGTRNPPRQRYLVTVTVT